ncbi:MAG TPA: shikimate dehydrogenase [Nitrospirota bacterium]|nr:shikimate dehydrogenase [Nitrospirota bacterium]
MISGKTKIYGIFGFPVEHTFSPGMHNAAFRKLGMDACYVPFAVNPSRLKDAVKAVIPLGLGGLNITVPHKEKVIAWLDQLSEEARLIGAVNTIEVKEGRLIGHNTDGRGFIRSLRDGAGFDPKGKSVLIAGAGGAARAVGFCLALAKAEKIAVYDVDAGKAARLARDIRRKTGIAAEALSSRMLAAASNEAHCVINATPLGLKKNDPLPLGRELIRPHHLVCDLVYNPPETGLLKAAKDRGARRLPGIGMLLYQGVIAFEQWTGARAPVPVMKYALARQIAGRAR